MKYVACDEHQVRLDLDDLVDRRAKYGRDVGLPLVDPGGGLPLELAVTEVEIREMDETHRARWEYIGAGRGESGIRNQGLTEGPRLKPAGPQEFNRFVRSQFPDSYFLFPVSVHIARSH